MSFSLFSALDDDAYTYSSDSHLFRSFIKLLELTLFALTIFVIMLWVIHFFYALPVHFFETFYIVLWVGVCFEYFTKLYFSKHKLEYVKNEWFSLIILVFPVLRPLQIFGLSRFIILIVTRQLYSKFIFLQESRVLEILLVSIVVVILSADLFLVFEQSAPNTRFNNFTDALWFSVVTVATIGYGDVVPVTLPGRILATFLIIFGVSVFGIITGTISSYLVTRRMRSRYSTYTSVLDYAQEALGSHNDRVVHSKLDEIISRLETLERESKHLHPH